MVFHNLSQSQDIGQNSDGGISNFRIAGQIPLIDKNCHNFRVSNDIDMKCGPVIKLDKRNTATSKNLTMVSCGQIVTSLSFFQFMANLEQSRSCKICKTYIFINLYLTKIEKDKESLKRLSYYCFEVLFFQKNADFLQKKADITKIKGVLILKNIFSKTTYVCILTYEISSF